MATTSRFEIDVEAFLEPITPEKPAGNYLRYNDSKDKQVMASVKLYQELEDYRREDENAKSEGDWARKNRKTADWGRTVETATTLLQRHTKDLQVVVWLVEALGRLHGVRGILSGLSVLNAVTDRFWDVIHPFDDDPEERIELRTGVFEWLDSSTMLPLMILKEPIVQIARDPSIRCSCLDEKQIREFEELCRKRENATESPTREELEEQWRKDEKIRIEAFQNYVRATPLEFYENLRDDFVACREMVEELNTRLADEERFGDDAVPLMSTLQSIDTCRDRIERILRERGGESKTTAETPASPKPDVESSWDDETTPDSEQGSEDESSSDTESDSVAETESDSWDGSESNWETVEEEAPPTPALAPRRGARPKTGPILDADDAAARVAEAAAFLRQADPGDPAPYLVLAALRMGESYRSGGWTEGGLAPAPPTESRQALRRLIQEGDWSATLAEAEAAIARPDGRGWLDAHRLVIRALAEQGFEPATRAARAFLGGWLTDQPQWPNQELDDATPAANAESRSWAAELVRPAATPEPPPPPLPEPPAVAFRRSESDSPEKTIDPWDQARELVARGRVAEAVSLLNSAARSALTGRERFLRRLQQAQICVNGRRAELALPLLEDLARRIDTHHLEDWEESSLCGQVFVGLYQCLKTTQPDRAAAIYARLCQLDLSLALSCGTE